MTPAKRLQHMVCNSGREFSDDEVIAMSLCADAWNDMQGLRHENIQQEKVCKEIIEIMNVYHEQHDSPWGVGTPGGLEHMGDVWALLSKWERLLKDAK